MGTEMIRLLTPPNPYGYSLSFMTELLRRSSSKTIIPSSIDQRVEANLSGKKCFSHKDLEIANDAETEISDIDVELNKERHSSLSVAMGGASKAARRGQIVQAQAEKSDSAKKIQKIVRGKQGRKKAHAILQFKENKKANNGRSEGGKKKKKKKRGGGRRKKKKKKKKKK